MKDSIRNIREVLGMTQEQLAGILGMSRFTMSQFENGNQRMPFLIQNILLQLENEVSGKRQVFLPETDPLYREFIEEIIKEHIDHLQEKKTRLRTSLKSHTKKLKAMEENYATILQQIQVFDSLLLSETSIRKDELVVLRRRTMDALAGTGPHSQDILRDKIVEYESCITQVDSQIAEWEERLRVFRVME